MSNFATVLAVDLGASHGRVVKGTFDGSFLKMETVCDFENYPVTLNGSIYWDHIALANNVIEGIKKAGKADSVGIDSWGHDFIPVTPDGNILGAMYAYRDERTSRMADYMSENVDNKTSYMLTGDGGNGISTRVQLCALKNEEPQVYNAAGSILFVADYINYLLCGKMKCNETQMSMGGLYDIKTRSWCKEICKAAKIRDDWGEVARCGEIVGETKDGLKVIAVASHDTASAFSFLPKYSEDNLILSSGTWALVGVKTDNPCTNDDAYTNNLQIELGAGGELLQINNLTGMWIMQELSRDWGGIDYDELNDNFFKSNYSEIIDTQDPSLSVPGNMSTKIDALIKAQNKPLPKTKVDYYRTVLLSLLEKFKDTICVLERMYNKTYTSINIVGGGAKNKLFNQLIADTTKKKVIAGPYEATSIGNMLEQLIALGKIKDRHDAIRVLENSFEAEIFNPKGEN